jgi:two-component system phosphate regulon sensor histidine kinase PhoR
MANLFNKSKLFASIRWRIIIPYTLLILVSLAGMGVYIYERIYQTQLQTLEGRLKDNALLISHELSQDQNRANIWQAINSRAVGWADLLDVRVTIIGLDGTVVGESHQDFTLMDNHLDRPEIQAALQQGFGSNIRYSKTVKYDMLYVAVPISDGDEVLGIIRIALPLAEIDANQTL